MPFRRKVVGVGMLAREDFVFERPPANFDQSVELWELFTFASMSLARISHAGEVHRGSE